MVKILVPNCTVFEAYLNVNIHHKVKDAIQRMCHNILPAKDNLNKRGIGMWPNCVQCGSEVETVFHVLFLCQKARPVWKEWKRGVQWAVSMASTCQEVFRILGGAREGDRSMEEMAMISWNIWNGRNCMVFQRKLMGIWWAPNNGSQKTVSPIVLRKEKKG